MKRSLLVLVLTGVLFASGYTFAQNEANHWMFGFGAGFDFSTGAPVPEQGCLLGACEGAAAISDPVTGNLLMYTDGMTVYTANHTIMPNGTGLKGDTSTTQSALIVPQPGSSTLFYVFTADAVENACVKGYNYSVVDMTLNGGLGDVVPSQKNISLFAPCSEQLSAVKHANCIDWWIMTKELGNNRYRAYLLTSTGVSAPVSSSIGMNTPPVFTGGQAKFSPDGTKYAISISDVGASLTQLFDFDNATGSLSNPITLRNTPGEFSYGVSFSGDNSKLYVTNMFNGVYVYQYDLSSGVLATIVASGTIVGNPNFIGQLQLGKDFKLYIAFPYSNLSIINNPNALGSACGFSANAIPLTGFVKGGLCHFPDSYFNQGSPCIADSPVPDVPEEPETIPQIPNIITSNGDGINDVFKIGNLPPASSLCIMNRWGNLVLMTDHYTNDWMGDNVDGVYFYVLKLPNGNIFNGFIHVVAGN